MNNITFNLELNHKPNKEGLYEVFLRITHNRKLTRVKTEVFTKEDAFGVWTKIVNGRGKVIEKRVLTYGAWVTKKDKDQVYKNRQLEKKIEEWKKAYDKLKDERKHVTTDTLTTVVEQPYQLKGFLGYFDKVVKRMDNWNNSKGYTTTRAHLVAYLTQEGISESIDFRDMTADFMRDFERYLTGKMVKESVYTQIKRIRKVFNEAINVDKIITRDLYIFNGEYKMPVIARNAKTKANLNQEELNAFINQKYEVNSLTWCVQQGFFTQYMFDGMRIENLLTLQVKNVQGEYLIYNQKKGKLEKEMCQPIPDQFRKLLNILVNADAKPNTFIFPFLKSEVNDMKYKGEEYVAAIGSATAVYNKYLKVVANDAGIGAKITTHVARHTFAGIAESLMETEQENRELSKRMGHASQKQTDEYKATLRTNIVSPLKERMLAGLPG